MLDLNFRKNVAYHIRRFLLHPPFWDDAANSIGIQLNWNRVKFESRNKNRIPSDKGIYCFVLKPKYPNFFETRYLFYVGKTNRSLKDRYKEYLNEQAGKGKPRVKVEEMLNIYKDHIYFYFAPIRLTTNVDSCEVKILNTFLPNVNSDIPNAKIKPELQKIYEL